MVDVDFHDWSGRDDADAGEALRVFQRNLGRLSVLHAQNFF